MSARLPLPAGISDLYLQIVSAMGRNLTGLSGMAGKSTGMVYLVLPVQKTRFRNSV